MTNVIGIRANASATIGFGHVRRCLSLAEVLLETGAEVVFFTNPESQPTSWLPRGGSGSVRVSMVPDTEAETLEQTYSQLRGLHVQALVVDSYDAGAAAFSRAPVPVAAILDAPPVEAISATLIVNSAADAASMPHPLAVGGRALLGPDYVLLRREFRAQQPRVLRSEIANVLITAGGADPTGLSLIFVDAARDVLAEASITVVVGPYFSENVRAALQAKAATDPGIRVIADPSSVRDLMLDADLALTSGGQTTYELAATGVPACAVRVALNQTCSLDGLKARNALLWVADVGDSDLRPRLLEGLRLLAGDPQLRQSISHAGQQTVDGQGAVRVAAAVLELCA